MKKLLISITFILAITTNFAFACNINILPQQTNVCYGQTLTADYPNYFTPVSFLWSTGETTSTISITASGSYGVSVTGFITNPSNLITRYKCRYYSVSPNPVIIPLTAVKVCKFETVELITNFPSNCGTTYEWFTGQGGYSTGHNFLYTFTAAGGPPRPDTLTVWCKITANGCVMYTNTLLVRSYRNGQLADWFHGNPSRLNLDLSSTIPAGAVLNYPVSDELKFRAIFTEVGDTNQVVVETAVGSIQIPLSGLEWSKQYDVEVFPVVNGIMYCSGRISRVGIKPAPVGRLSFEEDVALLDDGPKTFTFFSVTGQVVLNKKNAEKFDQQWLNDIAPQVLIMQIIDSNGKNVTRQITTAK
jgi:hypothetical protein